MLAKPTLFSLHIKLDNIECKAFNIIQSWQDPYHNPDQAEGLSFSVPLGMKIPPSLVNIYKELQIEYPERNYKFEHGNLENWFIRENIFLLNASLTVKKNQPGCHMKIWQDFTNDIIRYISENNNKCDYFN